MKRSKPKPKPKRPSASILITREESESMFAEWMRSGNMSDVARKFNRSRTTVQRTAKKQRWKYRRDQIQDRKDGAIAKAEAKMELKDAELVHFLRNKVFNEILAEAKIINPSVSDAVRIIELAQELAGQRPVGDVNIFQMIQGGTDAKPDNEGMANRFTSYGQYFARIDSDEKRTKPDGRDERIESSEDESVDE